MDVPPGIWLCPATSVNLQKSILRQHNGSYIWAFNAKREKSWNSLRIGDICIFGNLDSRDGIGYRYLSYVTNKLILDEVDDQWPFKSPSGTAWKYAFTVTFPVEIGITRSVFSRLRPTGPVQQQTMLKGEDARRFREFVNNLLP